MAFLIGYDVGSSSIKATLLDARSGRVIVSETSPDRELEIIAEKPGWAEQHPQKWFEHLKKATDKLRATSPFDAADVKAIGISYQMHGLVAVDKNKNVLRPAIIWCDSRAVEIGEKAADDIGRQKCLENLLNFPANFTASKLAWVRQNEPDVYEKIDKIMLPGDYIAMRLTDRIVTTPSGLSEAILWNFKTDSLADFVLANYGISGGLIPEVVPTFGVQGELTSKAANELGLTAGTPITYRAGDQPNNALSLNVLEPGEITATAGTSGVVCGITEKASYDPASRVNTFVHVNHSPDNHRYSVLLCLNGCGILNSWLKHNLGDSKLEYEQMNESAAQVEPGCDGLMIFPYGNGAERPLGNRNIGAFTAGWNFNVHDKRHFFRAAQEGIVFALNYGLQIMRDMGIEIKTVRAGKANMFLSPVFAKVFATVTDSTVQLYNTDGSAGAARGAGFGAGLYKSLKEAFADLEPVDTIEPDRKLKNTYEDIYGCWKKVLEDKLKAGSL